MLYIQVLVMSIIQGITELFPVSSSAHLLIARLYYGISHDNYNFEIGLNIGSTLAILSFFYKDWYSIAKDFFQLKFSNKSTANINQVSLLIISTIPILFAGMIITMLNINLQNSTLVIVNLIVFGLLLYLADKYSSSEKKLCKMTCIHAVIIGIIQILALFSGVSRLGICITGMRLLGYDKKTSIYYSFLLAVPPSLLASIWALHNINTSDIHQITFIIYGILTTYIITILSIKVSYKILNYIPFKYIMYYRIVLAIILFTVVNYII